MRATARILALVLMLALLMCAAQAEEDAYVGSRPAARIYVTQTRKHTCTLIAATMMLRNYAYVKGSPYEMLDEWTVGNCAWSKGWGLAQHFVVGSIEVCCSPDIRGSNDKKQYLIDQLKLHPEGIVIYDTGAPHAIFLFGYDPVMDLFYCADTIVSRGGRPIRLERSIIRGKDQAAKVNTIDKIWYIAGHVTLEA